MPSEIGAQASVKPETAAQVAALFDGSESGAAHAHAEFLFPQKDMGRQVFRKGYTVCQKTSQL